MARKYTEIGVDCLYRELGEFYRLVGTMSYAERQWKAQTLLTTAVQYGILVRPRICSACNLRSRSTLHGHHPDYKYPLKIKWLCNKCHRTAHKGEKFKVRKK